LQAIIFFDTDGTDENDTTDFNPDYALEKTKGYSNSLE
jgi:hypothetical protein